jgi:hypothetical protein
VVFLNAFYVYWFTVFTNHFEEVVLVKVLSSAVLALIHRFISAPFLRGGIFLTVLVMSRYGPCCDTLLVLCPQILLPGKLNSYDPGEIDFTFDVEDGAYDLGF